MTSVPERSPAAEPAPPRLSVVVASFRARETLGACLASLLPQCAAGDAELIVARMDDAAGLAALAAAYPGVRVVPVAQVADTPGADIPRLRGAGLAAARGRLAALTEDHCVAAPDWVATFASYVDGPADVIGGGMDNARRARALDWGAYFSEYGFFDAAGGAAPGGTPLLTGANVAYARRVLADVVAWTTAGAWENTVHDRLAAGGATLRFEPRARVSQNLTYSFGAFVADRYRHGHDYARVRLAEGRGSRWARAATTPLLPAVLTWRVARAAAGTGPRARAFARALPFTFAFLAAWSAGELAGYVRGPAR